MCQLSQWKLSGSHSPGGATLFCIMNENWLNSCIWNKMLDPVICQKPEKSTWAFYRYKQSNNVIPFFGQSQTKTLSYTAVSFWCWSRETFQNCCNAAIGFCIMPHVFSHRKQQCQSIEWICKHKHKCVPVSIGQWPLCPHLMLMCM